MPRVRGPPSARRRGRWSARPRGRAPSPTSPVPHTLYSTIPEAELRTTDRVTRPPTIKHITLPRPTSFFYYFLFFEKGSVESTHKVPTSHYRTKHCLLGGQSAHSHTEATGALAASFMTILRLLARQTRLPGATDNTRYGEGRASPRSFLTHHVANISIHRHPSRRRPNHPQRRQRAHAPGFVWGHVRCVYSERAVTVPSHRFRVCRVNVHTAATPHYARTPSRCLAC